MRQQPIDVGPLPRIALDVPVATVHLPEPHISALQRLQRHLLMIPPNGPEPATAQQAKTIGALRPAIDQIAHRDQQIGPGIKAQLTQAIHQQRKAAMQIAHQPDITPVAAVNTLIHIITSQR